MLTAGRDWDGHPPSITLVAGCVSAVCLLILLSSGATAAALDHGESTEIAAVTNETVQSVESVDSHTIVVSKGGGGDYDAIQPAVQAADPGARIVVRDGTYSSFRVSKDLTIVTDSAVIDGSILLFGTSASPTIRGFTIASRDSLDVAVFADESSGNWRLVDITTRRVQTHGVSAVGTSGDWEIVDSDIQGGDITVAAGRSTGNWRITNTAISGDDQSVNAAGGTITRSTIVGTVRGSRGASETDATGNYWGQPSGPRDDQCIGNVDCSAAVEGPAVVPADIGYADLDTGDDDDDGVGDDQTGDDEGPANQNSLPTPVLSADRPTTDGTVFARAGDKLTFDGSNSVDPDGTIDAIEWSLDGPTTDQGSGERFTSTVPEAGNYSVTLTVSDGTATATAELSVEALGEGEQLFGGDNIEPVAAISGSTGTTEAGERVRFSGVASTDPDGQLQRYQWDFDGDGEAEMTGRDQSVTFSYDDPGTYDATLTVVDGAGVTASATTSVRVVEEGTGPTAAIEIRPNHKDTIVAGVPLTLSAVESTDSNGEIVSYDWSFGDGTTQRAVAGGPGGSTTGERTGTSWIASNTYDESGSYTITLTVTDNQGIEDRTTTRIDVGEPPRPQIGPATPEKPGRMIRGIGLENSYFVPVTAQAEIESVVFEFPGGQTREASRVRGPRGGQTWRVSGVDIDAATEPGVNTVEVRATDSEGLTNTATFSIAAFDPPGWFNVLMGDDPTVTRDKEGRWVLESGQPTIPTGSLAGPDYALDVPVSKISGDYDLGLGASYGFEYVFAESRATAGGGGKVSFSTPVEGLDLDADIGGVGAEKSRAFSFDVSGTIRIAENAERAELEQGRVAFGTKTSATVPIAGVAVKIPKIGKSVGVGVDLRIAKSFKPGVTLEVNDARTAVELDTIELTQAIDLNVTAGAGGSADIGGIKAGLEARGIAGSSAEFTTEVYPSPDLTGVTIKLRAGVRACLGPCAEKWLLNDEYPLHGGGSAAQVTELSESKSRVGSDLAMKK